MDPEVKPPSNVEVSSAPPYVFVAWCLGIRYVFTMWYLVKPKDFTITLRSLVYVGAVSLLGGALKAKHLLMEMKFSDGFGESLCYICSAH
jgi:hypothetical protein